MKSTKLLNDFLTYLTIEKNASEHTINNYTLDIKKFFKLTTKENKELLKTDHLLIRSYLRNLKDQNNAQTTIARKISSLRSFLNF